MTVAADLDGSPAVHVVIGVDTHQDEHVAVAIDRQGVRLGECRAPANTRGYGELKQWSQDMERDCRIWDQGHGFVRRRCRPLSDWPGLYRRRGQPSRPFSPLPERKERSHRRRDGSPGGCLPEWPMQLPSQAMAKSK